MFEHVQINAYTKMQMKNNAIPLISAVAFTNGSAVRGLMAFAVKTQTVVFGVRG